MKMYDFIADVDREDLRKPTIGYENLHELSNDNGIRAVNLATQKNLIVECLVIPNHNMHKFTWTSSKQLAVNLAVAFY
jgi:hypothetical protein